MSQIEQFHALRTQALANYFVASKQMEQAERDLAAAETAINALQQAGQEKSDAQAQAENPA